MAAPAGRLGGPVVQRFAAIVEGAPYETAAVANELAKRGQAGSRSKEQIIEVLESATLKNENIRFQSWFAVGWFVERQYDRIKLPEFAAEVAQRVIVSIYDLERTLDYIAGHRWWYVGGYAALKWMEYFGIEPIPTDDLDIVIGGEALWERAAKILGEDIYLNHTQKIQGYSVQLISRGEYERPPTVRLGSSNVLAPEAIMRVYSQEYEPAEAEPAVKGPVKFGGGMALGIGSMAAAIKARSVAKEKAPVSLEKQAKEAKRKKRIEILQRIKKEFGV